MDTSENLTEDLNQPSQDNLSVDQPPEEIQEIKQHNGTVKESKEKLYDLQKLHGDFAWSNAFMQSNERK